ncbi:MAG: ABC transporter ATP-binding protein [Bdellovibrionales bacterium]|nr:ABC transporter ATP-binding protein [Bdellovibrionales bacterium]
MINKIELKQISFSYPNHQVFEHIDLTFSQGQRILLKGDNGSGKSTLLKIILGIIKAKSGHVINNSDFSKGFMPSSENSFFGRLTGYENLVLFSGLKKISKKDLDIQLTLWSKQFSFLKKTLNSSFFHCSSGMKKQLSVCRALINHPQLFVADEPFNNLDDKSMFFCTQLINQLAENSLVLISSHSPLPEDLNISGVLDLNNKPFQIKSKKYV